MIACLSVQASNYLHSQASASGKIMRPLPVIWGTKQEPGQEIAKPAKREPEIDDWKDEDLHYLADFPPKQEQDLDATFSVASDGKSHFTSLISSPKKPLVSSGCEKFSPER